MILCAVWLELQLDTCSIFVSGPVDLLKESAVSGSQNALSRYPTPLVGSLGLQVAGNRWESLGIVTTKSQE